MGDSGALGHRRRSWHPTIAAFLVGYGTGYTLAVIEGTNTQNLYGADVVSRLSVAINSDAGKEKLRRSVVNCLNRMIRELCALADVPKAQVCEMVIAGNTAMHHLFPGLSVRQLALAPFKPDTDAALYLLSKDIGLDIRPAARVSFQPPGCVVRC
ncbi:MAG: hypothetical protein KDA67_11220 [Rhodobacteraceae bacterium]|nr:hypothetical protein [Paracoccaceae bacterium]